MATKVELEQQIEDLEDAMESIYDVAIRDGHDEISEICEDVLGIESPEDESTEEDE